MKVKEVIEKLKKFNQKEQVHVRENASGKIALIQEIHRITSQIEIVID